MNELIDKYTFERQILIWYIQIENTTGLDDLHPNEFRLQTHKEILIILKSLIKKGIKSEFLTHIMEGDFKEEIKNTVLSIYSESETPSTIGILINGLREKNEKVEKLEAITSLKNDPDALYNKLEELYSKPSKVNGLLTFKNSMKSYIDYYENKKEGYNYNILHPNVVVQYGAVTVILGRTGQGKTTTMMNMLANDLHNYKDGRKKGNVLFLSLEESAEPILGKIYQIYCSTYERINLNGKEIYEHIKSGSDQSRLFDILLNEGHLQIMYSNYTIRDIETIVSQAVSKGFQTIFIDYIQKIRPESISKYSDRRMELGEISGRLVNLSVKYNLQMIIGAQAIRGDKDKDQKIEPFGDGAIREAGEIGNDANLIIAVQKKEDKLYYNLAKNRDGNTDLQWTCEFHGHTRKILFKEEGWKSLGNNENSWGSNKPEQKKRGKL